jgi:hypothetical protein
MAYPCASCNRDEGSPVCLNDSRCAGRVRVPAPIDLGPDEFIGKAKINGHWYSGRHMVRVAQITYDGSTCTVPLSQLVDMLGDGEAYQVRVTSMRKAEFDRLEEFSGW